MSDPPAPARGLAEAFDLQGRRAIFLIGAGGKTTLLFALARHLVRAGRKVVTTTSTKLFRPGPEESPRVIVEPEADRLAARLPAEFDATRHLTVARAALDAGRKLGGFGADELDRLIAAPTGAEAWVVEADGAAGRSLKAHNDTEPVIARAADLVIAVVGVDCLGRPLDDRFVHRAARFAELTGRPAGAPIRCADVAAILFHPEGYLRAVPARAGVAVFVSKVRSAAERQAAAELARVLVAADADGRLGQVVLGDREWGRTAFRRGEADAGGDIRRRV